MSPPALRRGRLTVLLLVLAWAVWDQGGVALEWLGLDLLDVPGRLCLVFAVLGLADSLLQRLLPAPDPHG